MSINDERYTVWCNRKLYIVFLIFKKKEYRHTWSDLTCFKRASEHIMRSPLILCHLAYKPQISGPHPLPLLIICIRVININLYFTCPLNNIALHCHSVTGSLTVWCHLQLSTMHFSYISSRSTIFHQSLH